MTIYSSLTTEQAAHVAYLFADDAFGTDPNAYEYEVMDGVVIGRVALQNAERRMQNAKKPHTVAVNVAVREVPDRFVTIEMKRDAQMTIQSIARSVVERILKSQVEVNP